MEYRLPAKGLLASSRHELVIGIALVFFIGGIGGLVPGLSPQAVTEIVDHRVTVAWLLCCVAGGGLLLVSDLLPDRRTALLVEWPAFLLVGGGAIVYGSALLARWQGTAWLAEVTYLILGAACLWRSVRVILKVRQSRA
jgi:hypothetical protein